MYAADAALPIRLERHTGSERNAEPRIRRISGDDDGSCVAGNAASDGRDGQNGADQLAGSDHGRKRHREGIDGAGRAPYSARAGKPFIDVNCAALPEHLMESELFGYEKGAFSGAENMKPGLFEAAHGGTLFLDEIGELDNRMQAKLLRVTGRPVLFPAGGFAQRSRPMCASWRRPI